MNIENAYQILVPVAIVVMAIAALLKNRKK